MKVSLGEIMAATATRKYFSGIVRVSGWAMGTVFEKSTGL
jgi:hypothetical protein